MICAISVPAQWRASMARKATPGSSEHIWKAYSDGRCLMITPNHSFRTTDAGGEAYAALRLPGDRWLVSSARIRGFRFDAGVSPGELADDLAIVDIAAKLEEFERGAAVAVTREQVDELFRGKALGDGWSGSVSSSGD